MSADSRHILVTGANGFVGRHVCAEIVRRGWQIRGACRTVASCPSEFESVSVGEVDAQTDWTSALCGIDTVIHLAARVHVMQDEASDPLAAFRLTNTLGTEHLARCAAAAGVRRLVYVSSIKVNGEGTLAGQRYSERDAAQPLAPYSISKWEAEQLLWKVARETGLDVVIVRPPLVYGAGVRGNFVKMLDVLGKGTPLPFAAVQNQRSLVYVGNLADALLTCATHPNAAGQTYLVSDGEDVSTPELLRLLADAMGRKAHLIWMPPLMLRWLGPVTGKSAQLARLLGSLCLDSGKIRRELAWQPPYSLQQGLAVTVRWYNSLKK